MINLGDYQNIFDIQDTAIRCKTVLEQIDTTWKPIFEQFVSELDGGDYTIHSYAVTLTTTYHDALNPKYAEQKKESNIGRKYFIQVMKQVAKSEMNMLTLEFNGIDQQIQIYVESAFHPIWEAARIGRLSPMVEQLEEGILAYEYAGSHRKQEIDPIKLENKVREYVNAGKTPRICFGGLFVPLTGTTDEVDIINRLKEHWNQLQPVQAYLFEEKQISGLSNHILNLLSDEGHTQEIQILGTKYQLTYEATEAYKSTSRRQLFTIKEDNQLIIKGHLYYYEVQKDSPHQVFAVQMEGHNHIFTNIRALLTQGVKEWWIKKIFATHKHNNAKLMEDSMALLQQSGIEVRSGNEYYVGSYDNSKQKFVEEIPTIKARFIKAALLFAHVSGRIKLTESKDVIVDDEDPIIGDDSVIAEKVEYKSHFQFSSIYDMIASSSFTFSKEIIKDLHLNLTAMDDKHFVVLSGISGTGKTQLARLYANAVYGLEYEEDNPYLSIIPVRPDWTDSTSLFGYYSSFDKRYVVPEFLRVLLHAQQEREKPHFIVLDEMNLARVEYYLSDYLSGVESHREIPLHNRNDVQDIPGKILIPPNVYVIGTVNIDETTYTLSDKVLDRAFVMALSDVDFETFWSLKDESVREQLDEEFKLLLKVHEALAPFHLHFGYRTMQEMLLKLSGNLKLEEDDRFPAKEALDRVISEKILPKLRGDEGISALLTELKGLFIERFGKQSVSLAHIERMEKELTRYGATQFWR